MKKILFFLVVLLFLFPSSGWCPPNNDSTCTETITGGSGITGALGRGKVKILEFGCTFDSGDGSFADYTSASELIGWILIVETDPGAGAEAPDVGYDIDLDSENGADLMNAALHNRATATTELTRPYVNDQYDAVPYRGNLTIQMAENTVVSATTKIRVFYTGDYL